MGANFTEKATTRVARSVTFLEAIAHSLDRQRGVIPDSTSHTTKSSDDYIETAVCKQKSLKVITGRFYSNFKTMSSNPLKSLHWVKMKKWIQRKAVQFEKHNAVIQEENVSDEEVTDNEAEDTTNSRLNIIHFHAILVYHYKIFILCP